MTAKKNPRIEINRSGDYPFLSIDLAVCSTPIEFKPITQAGLLTLGSLYLLRLPILLK